MSYFGNDWSSSTELSSLWLDNLEEGARQGLQAGYSARKSPLLAPLPNAGVFGWQGTPASWTAPAAAQTVVKADTAVTLAGDTSYAITSKGDGAFISGVNTTQQSFSFTANPGYNLAVWIWVDDPTKVKSLNIYASSGSGNSYYWDLLLAAPSADKPVLFPGRWRRFTLSPNNANVQGTPNAAALTRVVFNVTDNNAVVTVRLANRMEWVPGSSAKFPNGAVSMDFDDSWKSVQLAIPVLGKYGYRASLVPIMSTIQNSSSTYLSWDDIREIQDNLGWPVKSHCRYDTSPVAEHAGFETLTEKQIIDSITSVRDQIISNGLYGSEDWATPNGTYGVASGSTRMVAQILGPYIRSARVTQSQRSVETLPPGDRFMLANRSDVGGPSLGITAYTTATTGILDKVVASQGWAHMTFHQVIPSGTATNNQINVADFTTLVAACAAKGIAVLPTAEVLAALSA